jgi:hypothetical protein
LVVNAKKNEQYANEQCFNVPICQWAMNNGQLAVGNGGWGEGFADE